MITLLSPSQELGKCHDSLFLQTYAKEWNNSQLLVLPIGAREWGSTATTHTFRTQRCHACHSCPTQQDD